VAVDSRQVGRGDLFVALRGERTDGHRFVCEAFRRGARVALVERGNEDSAAGAVEAAATVIDAAKDLAGGAPPEMPLCVQVTSTLTGLQTLAASWREAHPNCRVVGVTGSVGKTTTTQLVAAVLAQRFGTRSSPENYNNEIGLPLSVLRIEPGTEWLAQEMAMYGLEEIRRLAAIARPEVGVVTNVGPTHLERLGTIDRIAEAKSELVQTLPLYGLAVLNGDDPRVRAMSELATARRVLYYGLDEGNDLWADEVQVLGLEGTALRLHWRGESVQVRLPLMGRHIAYPALAAAAVGLHAGLSWPEIAAGLQDRQAQVRLRALPGIRDTTVLDDSYNASPISTIAALDLLAEMRGRRVAVLGGMLELGSYSEEGHRLVGRRVSEAADLLVAVGDLGRWIAYEALRCGMRVHSVYTVADNSEALRTLERVLESGDFVLVKGSRGVALDAVVDRLTQPGSTPRAGREA
jgi:UDP-N-acetylmuramoyl-tripeptide--D-alanyl-D-alanine ligase